MPQQHVGLVGVNITPASDVPYLGFVVLLRSLHNLGLQGMCPWNRLTLLGATRPCAVVHGCVEGEAPVQECFAGFRIDAVALIAT